MAAVYIQPGASIQSEAIRSVGTTLIMAVAACIGKAACTIIVGNTISENSANDGGGLWASSNGIALIADNSFVSNDATGQGGGLWVWAPFIAVTDDAGTPLVSPDDANMYENNRPNDIHLQ